MIQYEHQPAHLLTRRRAPTWNVKCVRRRLLTTSQNRPNHLGTVIAFGLMYHQMNRAQSLSCQKTGFLGKDRGLDQTVQGMTPWRWEYRGFQKRLKRKHASNSQNRNVTLANTLEYESRKKSGDTLITDAVSAEAGPFGSWPKNDRK